jgi:hypothetical protein
MEEQQESRGEIARFSLSAKDISTLCIKQIDTALCVGVSCPMYQNCWADLKPNEEGYFLWKPQSLNAQEFRDYIKTQNNSYT